MELLPLRSFVKPKKELYAVASERHLHRVVRCLLLLLPERVVVLRHRPPLGQVFHLRLRPQLLRPPSVPLLAVLPVASFGEVPFQFEARRGRAHPLLSVLGRLGVLFFLVYGLHPQAWHQHQWWPSAHGELRFALLPFLAGVVVFAPPIGRRLLVRTSRALLALLPLGELALPTPMDQLPLAGVPPDLPKTFAKGPLQPFHFSLVLASLLAGSLVAGRGARLPLTGQLPLGAPPLEAREDAHLLFAAVFHQRVRVRALVLRAARLLPLRAAPPAGT